MHKCEADNSSPFQDTSPTGGPYHDFGAAVNLCEEREDGTFYMCNDEYGTLANFCPFCGAKAPKQVEIPLVPQAS